jgi:signal transduction histidine kinase
VILTRLFVREKLNILVIIPLVVVLVTTVPFVADRLTVARSSVQLAKETKAATEVARLVQELQRERSLALAFLAGPAATDRGPLVRQAQRVFDVAADVRAELLDPAWRDVVEALPAVAQLSSVRGRVLQRAIGGVDVYKAFQSVIVRLTDSLRRNRGGYTGAVGADHVAAFRALVGANEDADAAGAALIVALSQPGGRDRSEAATLAASAQALEQVRVEEFQELAPPAQVALFNLVRQGRAAATIAELGGRQPGSAQERSQLVAELSGAVRAQSAVRLLVQDNVAREVEGELSASARKGQLAAATIGALSLATMALVIMLSVVVGRSIARPLRRLAVSAGQVSDLARAELVRVSDEDLVDNIEPPQLAAIDIRSSDEIGELAVAFNRVQATAALLLERQVVTRRNFATMFANIGRRTQNLVGRQLALIDQLERDERDSAVLENLYRLDHLSTRLQRSSNSLVVLSGRAEEGTLSQPMPLSNAIRAGLGEIEGFRQVQLIEIDRVLLTPSSALDIVLVLAELLENATSFSPPHLPVEVTARLRADKCTVLIVDHGIGMSDVQLEQENRRLVERERLDLAPTDVLGLFVVGRLARRHSLIVQLRETPGGGVTAEVTIPAAHLIRLAPDGQDGQPDVVLNGPVRRGRPAGELEETVEPMAGRPLAVESSAIADQRDSGFGWWQSHRQVPAGSGAPAVAAAPAPAASGNGLRRRVRGARRPDTDPVPESPLPTAPRTSSADAARAMVEEFEAAVRQASLELPPEMPPSPPPGPLPPPPPPPASAAERGWNLDRDMRPDMRQEMRQDMRRDMGPDIGRDASSGAPPPGASGLRRRVRGAQLPVTGNVLASSRGRPRESSADAARAMVDEFEGGVTRANGSFGDPDGRLQ